MRNNIENDAVAFLRSVAKGNSFEFNANAAHREIESAKSDYLKWLRGKRNREVAMQVPARDGGKRRTYSAKTLLKALVDLENEYHLVWPLIEDDILVKVGGPAECEEMQAHVLSFIRFQKSLVSINSKVGRPSGSQLYPIILPLLDIFLKFTGVGLVSVQVGKKAGKPLAVVVRFVNLALDAYELAADVKRPRKKTPSVVRDIDETIIKAIYYWRDLQPTKETGYLTRLAAKAGIL